MNEEDIVLYTEQQLQEEIRKKAPEHVFQYLGVTLVNVRLGTKTPESIEKAKSLQITLKTMSENFPELKKYFSELKENDD